MTYPLSNPVSAGQPTAAQQYNDLRADALYWGLSPADSLPVGALLGRYQAHVRLEALGSSRVRVPASAEAPAALVVDGCMLVNTQAADLAAGLAPSGAAAVWYVFAVRTPGSTGFSLDVNTSAGETSGRRRIGRLYWDGSQILPASVRTEAVEDALAAGQVLYPLVCEGRLSLVSGTPVTTGDASGAVLYFCPYLGSRAALYTPGVGWGLRSFNEISLPLAGLSGGVNYDVFLREDAGGLALELGAWASSTARAAPLGTQDGVWVAGGAPHKRYLGTLRLYTQGLCVDSDERRFLWNCANRLPRRLRMADTADSWIYTSSTWRGWNNSSGNRVQFVVGLDEVEVRARFQAVVKASARGGAVGIGLDNSSSNQADSVGSYATLESLTAAQYWGYPGAGFHYLQMLEAGLGSSPSVTFFGDAGGGMLSSLEGWLMG